MNLFLRPDSIRNKLVLIILGISLLAILFASFAFFLIGLEAAKDHLNSKLLAEAEVLAFNCTGTLVFNDPTRADVILSALQYQTEIIDAGIFDSQGNLFSYYSQSPDSSPDAKTHMSDGFYNTGKRHTIYHGVILDGERIGSVFVTADLGYLDQVKKRYLLGWVFSILIALLLASMLTYRLERLISRPLQGLAQTARTITKNEDFSVRAVAQNSDEVGDLVEAFNKMLDQIQRRRDELLALYHLGRLVDLNRSMEQILTQAVNQVVKPLDANGVFLCLGNKKKLVLRKYWLEGAEPQSGNSAEAPPALRESIKAWCLKAMDQTSPQFFPLESSSFGNQCRALREMGYREFAAMPLISGGESVGVLGVVNKDASGFSDRKTFMKTLSSHIAVAIQNAMLYSEAQALSKNLEQKVILRTRELAAANERLTELDQMKSIFLASMSHELRTPLNSIIGFSGVLLKGMSGELNQEQKKQLAIVKRSSEHLLKLISDVLDISKIEAGKVDLEIEEFDLAELVREEVESVLPAANQAGLELTTQTPESLIVQTDERRLKQILLNLLSNAVKFTPEGQVSIKLTRSSEDRFQVSVKDTGVGLSAAEQTRVFMPFQQLTNELTRKAEGTGLGLHLSVQLANMLGGDISVVSTVGQGSEFTVELPISLREKVS